jgi:AraC-like DNA-binding protein
MTVVTWLAVGETWDWQCVEETSRMFSRLAACRPTFRAQQLRARGLTDSEIATAFGVSRRTVQRYLWTAT